MDFWRGVRCGGGGGGGWVIEACFEVGVVVVGALEGWGWVWEVEVEVEDEDGLGWLLAGFLEVLWLLGRLEGDGF